MDSKTILKVKQKYGIVGDSEGLNRALDIAIQVASTDLSVLIMGESGVGKEVLPRVIHDNSARKHNKYFAINCGSIPEGTIDSELFGHKKGSFTGALEDREGYFGAANNGTLFLDEVGELPLATQARLLRVLETGEYIRVGESEVRKTNVRIVAATNVNMQKALKEGKFREDLYYRLNTIPISVPPLRDRGKDIELLFRKFAYDMAEKYGIESVRLTEDAKELLRNHKWPGNIRQLRNLTERITILCRQREITADVLKEYGVTDDSAGETGLMIRDNSRRDKQNASDVHSYDAERDMLLGMLAKIGNEVQELKNLIHGKIDTVTHKSDEGYTVIKEGDLSYQLRGSHYVDHGVYTDTDIVEVVDEPEEQHLTIKEVEKMKIIDALKRNNGNRKKTSEELGIASRTLYRKIKEYGLNI